MTFQKNKDWSDKFIPEIQSILAPYFIRIAGESDDMKKCSDLITYNKRIAVRTRKHSDLAYKHEFTIRCFNGGHMTELEKLATGWGDYVFYSFANEREDGLAYWALGDFKVFRNVLFNNRELIKPIYNKDNTTGFCAFKWADFPGMMIAEMKQ